MHAEIAYFIELLGAFVRREPAPPLPNIDARRLLSLSKYSNLSGMCGYMLQPHMEALEPDVALLFSKQFYQTIGTFSNCGEACTALQKQLQDNHIPFALLKGAVLSRLYPAKELRTFGDVDVYIPSAYVPQLRELLAQNNDRITHEDEQQICVSRPPLFIEFHYALEHDVPTALPALSTYLEDAATHMTYWEPVGIPTVDPLFHFIYLISHQMRHFESDSPGIRSYLDLAVFLKSGFAPDCETLAATLRQLGLYEYAATALTLVEHWFGVPSPLDTVEIDGTDIAFLEEYLCCAGLFAQQQNPRAKQVSVHGRLGALWTSLFPPKEQLRKEKTYAALSARCLPAAYIYRLFRGIFCRTGYVLSSAKAIGTATEDAQKRSRVQSILHVGGTK